jgi:hypothetical protein
MPDERSHSQSSHQRPVETLEPVNLSSEKLPINEFLRTALGLRMSTSVGGVFAGREADHQQSSLDCLPTASVNVLVFRRRNWLHKSPIKSPNCGSCRGPSCWVSGGKCTKKRLRPAFVEKSWFPSSPTKFKRMPMGASNLRSSQSSVALPDLSIEIGRQASRLFGPGSRPERGSSVSGAGTRTRFS